MDECTMEEAADEMDERTMEEAADDLTKDIASLRAVLSETIMFDGQGI